LTRVDAKRFKHLKYRDHLPLWGQPARGNRSRQCAVSHLNLAFFAEI